MNRLGIYGGSFDPIHSGHLSPVKQAAEELEIDRVLYVPTAAPPHKTERVMAPAVRRFAMVELALMGQSRMMTSDLELTDGPTYTVDTLTHYRAETDDEIWLLVGADSLAQIDGWRSWTSLFELARICVLRRPGWGRERVEEMVSPELRRVLEIKTASGEVRWANNEVLEISATEIRRRLASGVEIPRRWLPEAVLEYVTKYRLYE